MRPTEMSPVSMWVPACLVDAYTLLTAQTHITDPNERRRMALAEVDKAPFGWYHVRLAVVTGIGFFTDAYSVSPA
jgi:hypothetical protein